MIPVATCGTSEDIVMSAHHSDSSQGSHNLTILYGKVARGTALTRGKEGLK